MYNYVYLVGVLTLFGSIDRSMAQASLCPEETPLRYQYYPSLNDTAAFVDCSTSAPILQNCSPGTVYKPRTSATDNSRICVSYLLVSTPATFDCSGNRVNGTYSGDNSLYATCQNGQPVALHQCPTGEYMLSGWTQCNITCLGRRQIGQFAIGNGTTYYQCSFNYQTYQYEMTVGQCLSDQIFDDVLGVCTVSNAETNTASTETTTTADQTSQQPA